MDKDVINSCHGVNYTKDMVADKDGYYDVEIARFGRLDSQKRFVNRLSEEFIASLKDRTLACEYGHPINVPEGVCLVPEPGSEPDSEEGKFVHRLMQVDTTRMCCVHKNIEVLDMPDGTQSMRSKMKIGGPYGSHLQMTIDDKETEKVVFGYRIACRISSDSRVGVEQLVTVDFIPS